MRTIAAFSLLAAAFITTASLSAHAERRNVGLFDGSGNPFLVEVDAAPSSLVTLPSGHLPNPSIVFMPATRQRIGLSAGISPEQQMSVIQNRFSKAADKIQTKTNVIPLIKRISKLYGVDPAAVLAAIMGELTFNNEYSSAAQEIAAKAMPAFMNFRGAARVEKMFSHPALAACDMQRSDYWSWVCANRVWATSLVHAKGTNVGPVRNDLLLDLEPGDEPLHGVLRPSTGVSYGLGQISLVQVLMLSSDISARSNLPRITIDKMSEGLALLTTYEGTVHVIAAGVARSNSVYRRIAGFDISNNIGVQATLFNLGYDFDKAFQLRRSNAGKPPGSRTSPRENYFGYYMNEFEPQLRQMLAN